MLKVINFYIKYLISILGIWLLTLSCSKTISSVQSNICTFSSFKTGNAVYELEKLKCVFALDKTTNICYFREKEGWKALNPVVENFNQLKLVVGQVGQIITTQGFYFAGDGGHAKFKVYDFEPTKYNKYTCVKLSNSNYAIRLFEEEVNVLSFGAKGNTDITGKGDDDTIAFQNAIDYISDEGGGFLYIPSKKRKIL
jgi:hypothetical protein